ncbi:hypothetical protein IC582_022312 [Cucumis melo]
MENKLDLSLIWKVKLQNRNKKIIQFVAAVVLTTPFDIGVEANGIFFKRKLTNRKWQIGKLWGEIGMALSWKISEKENGQFQPLLSLLMRSQNNVSYS